MIAPNIRLEYQISERPAFDFPRKVSGLTKHVSGYIYNHIDNDLMRIRQKVVDYVYSRVRTRRLDRATVEFKQKVNQYSSDYGIWFNYLAAPHLSTIIGDKDVLVKPRHGTYLTIPNTYNAYGIATGVKPNARIRDFGITNVKFNPAKYGGTPYWYKGEYPKSGKRSPKGTRRNIKPRDWRQILFWGVKSVVRTPKISPSEIREVMTPELQEIYKKLAVRGIAEFFRTNK